MKFTDWMKLREQAPIAPTPNRAPAGPTQAKSNPNANPNVQKLTKDILNNKGNVKKMKPTVTKVADEMLNAANKAVNSGDIPGAIDQAIQSAEIRDKANKI